MTPPKSLEERAKEYYEAAGFLMPSHNYLRNFASIELHWLRDMCLKSIDHIIQNSHKYMASNEQMSVWEDIIEQIDMRLK